MTTTTTPAALSTLTVSYELTTDAADHLGDDARSVWSTALTTELEARFPGCEVDVTTRWSSVDASRCEIKGETTDGLAIAGGKDFFGGVDVFDGDADSDVPVETLRWIAERITDADRAAWQRACESVA